jgi:hypothetical protein
MTPAAPLIWPVQVGIWHLAQLAAGDDLSVLFAA